MTAAFIRASKIDGKRPKKRRKGIAESGTPAYTSRTKSKSFRVATRRSDSPLAPLLSNTVVTLAMSLPPVKGSPPKRQQKEILVVLTPGLLLGARREDLLVSVVGRGACVVSPFDSAALSRLVMSGIPSRLSVALMDEFRRLLTWR